MRSLFALLFCLCAVAWINAVDLDYRLQSGAYGSYDFGHKRALLRGDILPELSLSHQFGQDYELLAEYSAYGWLETAIGDTSTSDLDATNYRAWLRIGNPQTSLRLGLQRISFGSAKVLRPLQWFDKLDPLDNSEFTRGVWALLATHTWMNNSELWLWGMLAEDDLKGAETIPGKDNSAEFGARFQLPNTAGETGLAYHQRQLHSGDEFRIGFDHRWDGFVGAWLEGSYSYFDTTAGIGDSIATAFTVGLDYTFPLGNGLAITAENLLGHGAAKGCNRLRNTRHSLAVLINYPLSLLDSIILLELHSFSENTDNLAIVWRRAYDYLSWELGLNLDRGYVDLLSSSPKLSLRINYNI